MPPSVPLLFGPMLIGVFMNNILYGVAVVQMFLYYQTYRKDSSWLRYFVLFLFIAETINTAFDIAMMYEPLVMFWGNPVATKFFPITLPAEPILTVIISTPIQIFIAWRIRVISQTRWIAALIVLLSFVSFGGGVWLAVTVTRVRLFAKKPDLHWPAVTWLMASAVADVIITLSLVISLARRKTGFSGTDRAINRIIRLTIQTGLITAIFAVLDVVCFLALPHTTLNFVWDFALSKLYTNTLMSTLNARAGWDHLAQNQNQDNVLFGSDVAGTQIGTYTTSGQFRVPTLNTNASTAYEMDATKSDLRNKDLEYNISVSKEINTREDPLPPRRHMMTQ